MALIRVFGLTPEPPDFLEPPDSLDKGVEAAEGLWLWNPVSDMVLEMETGSALMLGADRASTSETNLTLGGLELGIMMAPGCWSSSLLSGWWLTWTGKWPW